MNFDESQGQYSPPPPQNSLERLLNKGNDPANMGRIIRALESEELFIYVPAHPELEGEMMRSTDDPLSFCVLSDEDGAFVPVFTSVACAAHETRRLPKGAAEPMIAGLPGQVLFGYLARGGHRARVMACGGGTLRFDEEGVRLLAEGRMGRGERHNGGRREPTQVLPVPLESFSQELLRSLRAFCSCRPAPLAVWAFHALNPEDGKPCVDEYRFILWLRESDPNFEQDFGMLTGKLLPPDKELLLGVVLPGQEDQLEYLRTVQPLWPEFPLGDAPAV